MGSMKIAPILRVLGNSLFSRLSSGGESHESSLVSEGLKRPPDSRESASDAILLPACNPEAEKVNQSRKRGTKAKDPAERIFSYISPRLVRLHPASRI